VIRRRCSDVDALGGKGLVCVADVAHATEVESAASMIEERLGNGRSRRRRRHRVNERR
jgi:hypothetical protein